MHVPKSIKLLLFIKCAFTYRMPFCKETSKFYCTDYLHTLHHSNKTLLRGRCILMGAVCVNYASALPVFNAAVVSVIAGAITVAAPMVAESSPVTSAAVFNAILPAFFAPVMTAFFAAFFAASNSALLMQQLPKN